MSTVPVATRPVVSLDGVWDFSFVGPAARLDGSRAIAVPGIWQAAFAELRNSAGTGTYRRAVDVPAEWQGKRIVLVLDGVFHETTIRIDGREVARHDNAWTPIELDVTDAGPRFDLEVEARVPDERDYERRGLGVMLHGKQDWYGLQGGIWKSVRLEAREPLHIADLAVSTKTDLATHAVKVRGRSIGAGTLRLDLQRDGVAVTAGEFAVDGAFDVTLPVEDVALWSPEAPTLYDLAVSLGVDAQSRTIGFRRFESRDGRLWLNDKPFYMFGARPGLVSGDRKPPPRSGLPRAALPKCQGYGPQHPALPR
jgi:beta-galactosidase/beta-glucuronidase